MNSSDASDESSFKQGQHPLPKKKRDNTSKDDKRNSKHHKLTPELNSQNFDGVKKEDYINGLLVLISNGS